MEINISDYVSEEDKREIAQQAFREMCCDDFKNDHERTRIISNAAYKTTYTMVDEAISEPLDCLIRDSTVRIIKELTTYTVFGRKGIYQGSDTKARGILEQCVEDNKEFLNEQIRDIIAGMDEDILEEHLKEEALILLDEKLFGANQ